MGYSTISEKISQVIDDTRLGNKKIDVLKDIIKELDAKEPSLAVRTATIGYGFHYANESYSQRSLLMVAACIETCVESEELFAKGRLLATAARNENLRRAKECFTDMAPSLLPENSIRNIMLSALLYISAETDSDESKVSKEQSTIIRAVELTLEKL